MTHYLLFTVIGTASFWGLYRLLLYKEHCLQLNRLFLLGTLAMSLLIPLIHPSVPTPFYNSTGNGYLISLPIPTQYSQPTTLLQTEPSPLLLHNTPTTNHPVSIIYWFGVAVSALLLLVRHVSIWRKLQNYSFTFTRKGRYRIAMADSDETPFSFFNYIVINRQGLSEDEADQVLAH